MASRKLLTLTLSLETNDAGDVVLRETRTLHEGADPHPREEREAKVTSPSEDFATSYALRMYMDGAVADPTLWALGCLARKAKHTKDERDFDVATILEAARRVEKADPANGEWRALANAAQSYIASAVFRWTDGIVPEKGGKNPARQRMDLHVLNIADAIVANVAQEQDHAYRAQRKPRDVWRSNAHAVLAYAANAYARIPEGSERSAAVDRALPEIGALLGKPQGATPRALAVAILVAVGVPKTDASNWISLALHSPAAPKRRRPAGR